MDIIVSKAIKYKEISFNCMLYLNNTISTCHLTYTPFPHIEHVANKGSIIFTSSVASVTRSSVAHTYLASKHAVVGFAKNLGVELGQHGIRLNCVSPFCVATPMLRKGFGIKEKEETEEFVSRVVNLKGTILEAEDVAEAAFYLASDESKYISGTNLVIDGGYSTTNIAPKESIRRLHS